MEIITQKVHPLLQEYILKAYSKIESTLNQTNDRTHHLNIYHQAWANPFKDKICKDILNILDKEYSIKKGDVLSFGFISGQPDCKEQHFHIDYDGVTETYFIPLCELNDKNGTEYLQFNSSVQNISLFSKLKKIGNRFSSREGVSGYLTSLGVKNDDYKFKIANSQPFTMIYLPNYVLHRGTSNKSGFNKVMFQILISVVPGGKIPEGVLYEDSELDEEESIVSKLLESRKNL